MLEAAHSDLVVIEVTGADRVTHLDATTSQRFTGLEAGAVTGVLVLSAKGAPLAVATALIDEERILLLAPPEAADHVLDEMSSRTFLADVTFRRLDEPVVSLHGSAEDQAALGPVDTWHSVDGADGPVLVAHHAFGVEVVGTDDVRGVVGDVEVVDDLDGLRIRRGEPRWGHEVVSGRLPEEYGLLATHVHLSKGCYPGQEPIAHMWMLGRPRRRLVRLEGLDAGDAVPEDASAEVTGRDGTSALAWVRPDVEVDDEVAPDVRVAAVVGGHREVVGWTPAQTRGRDRQAGEAGPRRRP